jgi:hypothetical protein
MSNPMDDSILETIKQALGLSKEPGGFDFELQMHINSALATLAQIGVPAEGGFSISGPEEKWSDLLKNNAKLNNVKSYLFMKVKMIFDSANMPAHLVTAYSERIKEEEWRIQVEADPKIPQQLPLIDEDIVLVTTVANENSTSE